MKGKLVYERIMILLGTVSLIQTEEVPRPMCLTVAQIGANVTLRCPVSEKETQTIIWYKQRLGYMLQLIAYNTFGHTSIFQPFNNSHFMVQRVADDYNIIIRNVSKGDEATYFCGVGSAFSMNYRNGTFLAVMEHNDQTVVQRPVSDPIHPGDNVTLQCSVLSEGRNPSAHCPGEPDVFWFRAGSAESHPGVLYTPGNNSNECEKSPESPSPPQSCVYSLSKNNLQLSDAGTYYCAVVACGEILFGNGTKLDIRAKLDPVVMVLGVLLVCCVIVIVILICTINRRQVGEQCKGTASASYHLGHDKSTVDQSSDLVGGADTLNYAALDYSKRRDKRGGKKREAQQECTYSAVRSGWQ